MRKKVTIFSFSLAVLVTLTGFIISESVKASDYKHRLNLIYQSAVVSLNENLENISTTLKKCVYYTSAESLGKASQNLTVAAQNAKNALSVLPAGEQELGKINRFLSHVGSYSTYIAAEVSSGKEFSDEQKENINTLITAAEELNAAVGEISTNYTEDIGGFETDVSEFSDTIISAEDNLTDYPALIFDGPFSDHILEGESQLLPSLEKIDEQNAKNIASEILNISVDNITLAGEQTGKIECYKLAGAGGTVAVTKNGGIVSFMRKYRVIGNSSVTPLQCIDYAKEFLQRIFGNKTFEESYYYTQDGLCIINFAYKDGATVCYTDLVKVGVATDNGEILFFEADGYIMNHKPRTIATPTHTAKQASKIISKDLSVLSTKQALILSDGNYEILCYEFLCNSADNSKVLVYINAADLTEERLFLVEQTDGGTFTK